MSLPKRQDIHLQSRLVPLQLRTALALANVNMNASICCLDQSLICRFDYCLNLPFRASNRNSTQVYNTCMYTAFNHFLGRSRPLVADVTPREQLCTPTSKLILIGYFDKLTKLVKWPRLTICLFGQPAAHGVEQCNVEDGVELLSQIC